MRAQLVLENVGVHLPNRVLFEKINWTLYEGMRVALAGRNGSGKSTLLRIMSGKLDPVDGQCTIVGKRSLRIGYLDQSLLDSAVLETKQLKDQSLSAVSFLTQRLERNRPEDDHTDDEWRIRKMLAGLGFDDALMDGSMNRLSGGWLLRMFIAGTLLDNPDVLLLDEPTNHLDLSSIQWLEEFLQKEYQGSIILVTHDVALQKRTTDSLAIVHGGHFYFRTHQRDYLTFRESLEEDRRVLEKNIEGLTKRIEEGQEFYDRFRANASMAPRAQSKLRDVQELTKERAELKDRLLRIQGFHYNLKFRFRMGDPGGKFPLVAKNVSFKYKDSDPWILRHVNIDVTRGQRIAIIGDNGAGKTTLLNVLAQRLKPAEGEVTPGYGAQLGYFGQHQLDELMLEGTVLDNLRAKATTASHEQLRSWLGAFGFHGDEDTGKKVKVLSGGERARLALLRILVTPVNVTLLDEPTNHLDIETKELLKDAIRNFEGTVLIVSHDREFLNSIADRIIYLSADHKMTDHLGDLESFFKKYPQHVRHLEAKLVTETKPAEKKAKPAISFEERKKIKNRIKSVERLLEASEQQADKLSTEKAELEAKANAAGGSDATMLARIAVLDKDLQARMIEWEKWGLELEQLKAQVD